MERRPPVKLLLAVPNEGPPPLDALHHGHCQSGPEGGQHRGPHRPCSRSYRRGTGPGASRHGGPCGGQERKRRRYQNGGRRQTCQKLQLQQPDQASPNAARQRRSSVRYGRNPPDLQSITRACPSWSSPVWRSGSCAAGTSRPGHTAYFGGKAACNRSSW